MKLRGTWFWTAGWTGAIGSAMKIRLLLGGAAILVCASPLLAENWPNWRGESGHGVAPKASPPAEFSPEKNVAWKVDLPGKGCSTPVVWDGVIYLTCAIGGKNGVVAYGLDGKERWRRTLDEAAPERHQQAGSGSNPSVLTDGERLFAYFKSGTLAGLTMKGEEIWKRNLHEEYSADGLKWDLGTSPIFAGGNVVVALMHNNNPSFLLAFDKASGKEVWSTPRDYDAPNEAQDAYTTPFVVEIDGVETIVTWGCDHLSGHDAKSGRELWRHGNFNPGQQGNWRVIASAAATDGIAIVPFGRGDNVAGVKLGGKGDTSKTHRLWTKRGIGSDSTTPAAHDGKCYVLIDKGRSRGTVACLDAKSGEVEWETQFPVSAPIYYASPLVAGDKLYCGRSDGTIFCGTITPGGLKDVQVNELHETLVATPVPVGKKLLVRTHERLWCFE